MDWSTWMPTERATLCFIRSAGRLLLMRKKRGLGAGKINAPGGRIEVGETALEAAVRETQEEVGVTPIDPQCMGALHFDFKDGYALHCLVYLAEGLHGDPIETDEADPFWVTIDRIPYGEMWSDDRYWLPLLLAGQTFDGYFIFDGETMLARDVRVREGELQYPAA